jgi:acyl carrier protein
MEEKMKEQIMGILSELRPEFDFTQDVNFIDEGMLDSFDVITLVTTLDDKFGISISGTDILPENFESVEKIEALLIKNGVKPEL